MKAFLLLMLIVSPVFAADYEAKETRFTIQDRFGFDRVFFNCDNVEITARQILREMGAKEIDVRCRGGLDRWNGNHLPAFVEASFMALNTELEGPIEPRAESVGFRRPRDCYLFNSIVNGVKDDFEIAELNMRRCSNLRSPTRIEMLILKE